MLVSLKRILNRSTNHFDSPSEKVFTFFFVILISSILHYAAYQYQPSWFKIDVETLGKDEPSLYDFGWFSTFASFGFYFGEIIPKCGPLRFLLLTHVISVWYIMLS